MNMIPKLSKKSLTKLINKEFRAKIIQSYKKDDKLLINDYARYVVDSTIISRDTSHSKEKEYGYGFSPINILCAVKENNAVEKRFFEFNSINHFLKDFDGASANEVVKCILIMWACEDKNIKNFDYQVIDKELVKLDKEIEEKKRLDEKINETGKKIKEAIEPLMMSEKYESYDVATIQIKEKLEKVLEEFIETKEIFKYVISFDRNTKQSLQTGKILIDIGYKIDDKADFVVLVCSVDVLNKDKMNVNNV